MLGGSSLTDSRLAGGQRYTSFNPFFVLSYAPFEKVSIFGEVYGQSKTGVGQGRGFNADAGILYLVRQNVVIDFSAGQRINGELNGLALDSQ